MSTPQPLNFKYTNAISYGIERPKTRYTWPLRWLISRFVNLAA